MRTAMRRPAWINVQRCIDGIDSRDRKAEVGGHDANDCVRNAVKAGRVADDIAFTAKLCLPNPITENCNIISARLFFTRQEGPPEKRPHSENVKEVVCTFYHLQRYGAGRAFEIDLRVVRVPSKGGKSFQLPARVLKTEQGPGLLIASASDGLRGEKALLVCERQRVQQHCVDDTKDRGGRADAKCKRANDGDSKCGCVAK